MHHEWDPHWCALTFTPSQMKQGSSSLTKERTCRQKTSTTSRTKSQMSITRKLLLQLSKPQVPLTARSFITKYDHADRWHKRCKFLAFRGATDNYLALFFRCETLRKRGRTSKTSGLRCKGMRLESTQIRTQRRPTISLNTQLRSSLRTVRILTLTGRKVAFCMSRSWPTMTL